MLQIYSLGVLLYELAVGHAPFNSTDTMETIHAHMTQPPPPLPSSLFNTSPHVLSAITAVIHKMMAKAPRFTIKVILKHVIGY